MFRGRLILWRSMKRIATAAALKTEEDVVYKTNSLGLRGREPGSSKLRIVVIGDSYTEGFGLSETEAFPFQPEAALKKEAEFVTSRMAKPLVRRFSGVFAR